MLINTYKQIFFFLWICFFAFPSISNASSITSYAYNKHGNLEQIIDPRGFSSCYEYDLLNRIKEIDYSDGKKVKYSYNLNGVRTKMEDHHGLTLFEPDALGQINKVTFPNGDSVSYYYDADGNLTKIIYPDSTQIEYDYDLSNRLKTVKDLSGVTTFEYDDLSNTIKKKIFPNGITTEYQYYKTRKISNVSHKKADGSLIEEYCYTYDENGNRIKIEKITSEGNFQVIYIYDKLNRIIKVDYSDGFFEEFSYDGSGNRLSKTTPQGTTLYEYENDENRLVKAGDKEFFYDLAGNLIKKSSPNHTSIYTYDAANRLISYSDEVNRITFEYDGDGNRISKTVNGVRTEYVNDLVAPITQVLLERVQGNWLKGEKTVRYTYGGSRISQCVNEKTQFYLYDSIGRNVSLLVNFSGKLLNSYQYDAFGGLLSVEKETPNAYLYCGEQFDEETGLIYLRNRYYDPEIGRFISKDPCFGKVNRPATLNPYCYVENNPINFIDPLGFESMDPEELELVIIYTNGLPRWFGGQGIGGHVFMGLPARNDTTPYFGNYPDGPLFNEAQNIHPKTVAVAGYCSSRKVDIALQKMKEMEWSFLKNCVHTVLEGMKIMEFPESDKIRLSPIPIPLEFQSQMLMLHETDPLRPLSYQKDKMKSSSPSLSSLDFNFSSNLDYGGISLSKTADLQANFADITGVVFDPITGQLVLFGPENRYLPSLDLEDLVVAVKSIYGIGISCPQDPGVSIGTDPSSFQGQMKVRYDGATANTSFGQIMFEADRLLKCLELGKDNNTGQPITTNVPGYSSLINRIVAYQFLGQTSNRMWFVPDQITLVEAENNKGMVFSDVRMKVLTESQFNGFLSDLPPYREFAEHFTTHFDDFAMQFPVLEKLKTLGKITAVIKWIRENNIPFDLSFFLNYQPKVVETPQYTTSIESHLESILTQTEKRKLHGHKHKKDVPVAYSKMTTLTGGIDYSLNSQNFAMFVDPLANDFTSSALKSRPSEQDFSWSFSSPTNRETFLAIAQNISRTRKPGNIKKSYEDMSFPVLGNHPFSLQRFYNSFSEKESVLGRGWRITPYELEFPSEKIQINSLNGKTCATYKIILFRAPEGEYLYEPFTFGSDDCPVFKSAHCSNFLKDNLNGTFSLFTSHAGHIDFDQQGRLVNILDNNGCAIEYHYHGHQLTRIQDQNDIAILLAYDGNRLASAQGPDGTMIQYTYHSDGQLWTVGNARGSYLQYYYDCDKRLKKITDHLENILFEVVYDDYNRAILVKEGSKIYQVDFSLENKTMIISDNQDRKAIFQYDVKDRIIYKQESEGLIWTFSYEQENINFPTKIIDPKGGVTECHYDFLGNPIYLKDSMGAEWKFFYDLNANLIAHREPNGRVVMNFYNSKNQLIQTLFNPNLDIDENGCFVSTSKGFHTEEGYAIYKYDKDTGQLISRENKKGAKTIFAYHKNGMQKEIISPAGYRIERKIDEKGRILDISDDFGKQISYDYDEFDRIKALHVSTSSTYFTYDNDGNLKMVLDPRGNSTSYSYDNNNLKEIIDAEDGISSYEYNSLNQLTHISLPNGSCKTIKYDLWGRIEQEIWGK